MAVRLEAVRNLQRHFSSLTTSSSSSPPSTSSSSSPPRAAVLIPLTVREGRLFTLMTLRSPQLRSGAGQVCFPGGKKDPDDPDETFTALREAREEVGLLEDRVQVVAGLTPVYSQSGLLVFPFVGFIEPSFLPVVNPSEVDSAFFVPLDFFLSSEHHAPLTGPSGRSLPSFQYRDEVSGRQFFIWGLTAALAVLVAAAALGRKPEFSTTFDPEDPQRSRSKL